MEMAWTDGLVDEAAVAAASPDGLFVVDASATITFANAGCEELLGWPRCRLVGSGVFDLVHPDDVALVASSMDSMREKAVGTPVELRLRTPDGEWRWVEIVGRNCFDDPHLQGIVCTARDITRRRMWEVTSGNAERLHHVLQHAPAIVLLLDRDGFVTGTNGAFTRLLGHDPSRVVGRRLASFAAGDTGALVLETAIEQVRGAGSTAIEVGMSTTRGPVVPIRFELVDLVDDPVVAGIAVTGHDVTELQEARSRLEHMASHDSLTDLPNRSLLARRLGELLAAHRPLALLYVDLDRFKPINDTYGHAAGDEVLRRVAQRLRDAVSPSDVIARVGGDEFVVLAVGITSPDAAVELAERLRSTVEQPYQLPVATVGVGASIGVALAGAGSSAESLIHEADDAMYEAKHA
jgi:diguanylate cyclase (GGDEF)-like protein/PAS domain S-box-containing protein